MSAQFDFHMIFVHSSIAKADELIGDAGHSPSEGYHTAHVVGAIRWLKCAKINLAHAEAMMKREAILKPLRLRGTKGGRV